MWLNGAYLERGRLIATRGQHAGRMQSVPRPSGLSLRTLPTACYCSINESGVCRVPELARQAGSALTLCSTTSPTAIRKYSQKVMAPVQRKKTRLAHSCTQCARRKVRCSKIIPCSSCVDRGLASQCHVHPRSGLPNTGRSRASEDRAVTSRDAVSSVTGSVTRPTSAHEYDAADRAYSPLALVQDQTRQFSPGGSRRIASSRLDSAQLVNRSAGSSVNSASLSANSEMITLASAPIETCNLANDSAVTLEFLALGRRNILGSRRCTASERPTFTPNMAADLVNRPIAAFPEHWDPILSHDEARQALDLHEESFVWYHNVVHLPAFRQEFESNLTKTAPDLGWLALYYAILCVSR